MHLYMWSHDILRQEKEVFPCSSHEEAASSPMVDDLTDETYKPILDHESDNEENSGDEVDG